MWYLMWSFVRHRDESDVRNPLRGRLIFFLIYPELTSCTWSSVILDLGYSRIISRPIITEYKSEGNTNKNVWSQKPVHISLSQSVCPFQWRHDELDGISNHQPYDCLLNRLFTHRSKKTSKLRVTGLCVGNSGVTGDFPAQRASSAENVSIWWRHHV